MPAYSLGGSSAWALTSHTVQTITGAKTFEAVDSATTPLSVVGVSGAAAPILNLNTSDGVNRFKFETNGVFTAGYLSAGTRIVGTTLSITAPSASTKGIVVRGAASQTANLYEFQDSAGYAMSFMNPSGHTYFEGGAATKGRTLIIGTTDYGYMQMFNRTSPGTDNSITARFYFAGHDSVGNSIGTGEIRSYLRRALDGSEEGMVNVYATVKGISREVAIFGDTTLGYNAFFNNFDPAARGLLIRGAASQTGNLFEIQTSASISLLSVDPAGIIRGGEAWKIVGATGSPAFETGWTHYYSATQEPLGFRKMADGSIKLKGLVKNAAAQAAGSIIFTLPAGYRPTHYMRLPVTTHTNTAGGVGRVDIGVGGQVYYITGNVAEMDLSSIMFYGEN